MKHHEIHQNNWKDKKTRMVRLCKARCVLCSAFFYARHSEAMDEITGFSMKDCLPLPGLGWRYFSSISTDEDEPIYTYNDKYRQHFVSESIEKSRVCAFNQNFKSKDAIMFHSITRSKN